MICDIYQYLQIVERSFLNIHSATEKYLSKRLNIGLRYKGKNVKKTPQSGNKEKLLPKCRSGGTGRHARLRI